MYAGQFEPEWEEQYNSAEPIDALKYLFYLITRKAEEKAQPRKKKSGTGTKKVSSSSKRVRKQVLLSSSEETENRNFDWNALRRIRKESNY